MAVIMRLTCECGTPVRWSASTRSYKHVGKDDHPVSKIKTEVR